MYSSHGQRILAFFRFGFFCFFSLASSLPLQSRHKRFQKLKAGKQEKTPIRYTIKRTLNMIRHLMYV
jgi:IS5 family transposase